MCKSNSIEPLEAARAAWQFNIAAIFAAFVLCYHVWHRQSDAIVMVSAHVAVLGFIQLLMDAWSMCTFSER